MIGDFLSFIADVIFGWLTARADAKRPEHVDRYAIGLIVLIIVIILGLTLWANFSR